MNKLDYKYQLSNMLVLLALVDLTMFDRKIPYSTVRTSFSFKTSGKHSRLIRDVSNDTLNANLYMSTNDLRS